MKKWIVLGLIFFPIIFFAQQQSLPVKPHLLVNPLIGTGGHGHTFPGPTMPFGACQLSPDTRLEGWDGCSGYHYSDSIIYGFSHTHLSGTGCSDYGDILLMPVVREMPLDNYAYAAKFSHKRERTHAGYYEVLLDDSKINVSLTTTLHGGVHRYQYPMGNDMYVVLDLKHRDELIDSKIEQVDDYTIRGYRYSKAWAKNQQLYYEIKFSEKILNIVYEPVKKGSPTTAWPTEKSLHCLIHFDNPMQMQSTVKPTLIAKCAISGVDELGAHKNLMQEMPHNNFKEYVTACENSWDRELSKVKIPVASTKNTPHNDAIVFYTALYHCMIHPSIYNDVDGRYRGRDNKIHQTEGKFDYYTVFSLWDTYRGLHPLLTILDKKRTNDFIQTFIKQYEQGGRLPIWELSANETNCMIGYHVVSVIWDAYNKGIRNYDVAKAYEAMTKIATHYTDYIKNEQGALQLRDEARERCADADALESYSRFGYVRSDDSHESVSKTLEYAYNDWCIAQMANALGKKKDYEYYLNRSQNWMNVYDPTTGFMRARKNGSLYAPFSPYTVDNNYTEANSWQYSFYVPHNMEALIALQGGAESFEKKLDDLFHADVKTEGRTQSDITGLIGQYAHGNEPSHHIAYVYHAIGKPEKSAKIIRTIIDSFYSNQPDGLIGNEDCGQMSAWYVLSTMGIYPTCPGNNLYDIVQPLYSSIQVENSPNIRTMATAQPVGFQNETSLTHQMFTQTPQLTFTQLRASNRSFREQKKISYYSVPFIKTGARNFSDSLQIEMLTNTQQPIMYAINQDEFKLYTAPFNIYQSCQIRFYSATEKTMVASKKNAWRKDTLMQYASFYKLPKGRTILLNSEYGKSYSAGGANALIDHIFGKLNWRAGDWQGYQGQDIEIIMQLAEPTTIHKIAGNFLEDQNAWIFYPAEILFYVSQDAKKWDLVEQLPIHKSMQNLTVSITSFNTTKQILQPVKYIKLIAKNPGVMPNWHEGKGNPTWMFIDEMIVE